MENNNSNQGGLDQNTLNILQQYGYGPVQGRGVNVVPPKITINNNYNNATTNNVDPGLVSPQDNSGDSGTAAKLKSWLSQVFDQDNQDIKKRQEEFDVRQSQLKRSSHSLLRKIEGIGKDIIEQTSPQTLGTTLRSQLYTLLFIFLGGFITKHFDGFMKVLTKVTGVVKSGLEYFGIIKSGTSSPGRSLFKNDVISFFGGKPGKDNLGTLFKRIFKDSVDSLFLYLKDGLEERAFAVTHIKHPNILDPSIGGIIGGIGNYLGQILEAITDPDSAMRKASGGSVVSAGIVSTRKAMQEEDKRLNEFTGISQLKDTSFGDYAAENRTALISSALDSSGNLKNNDVAEVSQSIDILGGINEAKSGNIDTARIAQGFQQLSDNASDRGYATVTRSFLVNTIGKNYTASLIRQGLIIPKRYKYIRVDKNEADLEAEDAEGFVKSAGLNYMGNAISQKMPLGLGALTRKESARQRGYGEFNQGAKTLMGGAGDTGNLIDSAITGAVSEVNNWSAKGHKLKLVPDTPEYAQYPAVEIDGKKLYKVYYKVTKQGLNVISNRLFGNNIDQYSKNFLRGIQSYLLKKSGGRASSYDMKLSDAFNDDDYEEYHSMKALHEAKEQAAFSSLKTIGNNAINLANNAIDGVNSAINDVYGFFSSSSSNFNGASGFGHPGPAQDRGESFNVQNACAQLNSGVFYIYDSGRHIIGQKNPAKSGHHCAMCVCMAIEAGGVNTAGHPNPAWQYVNFLPKIGFQAISFTNPQPGDIVVINCTPSRKRGHICMFNGEYWVSDFVQRTIWVGYPPVGVMFRHIRVVSADPSVTSAVSQNFQASMNEGAGGAYDTPYGASSGFTSSQIGDFVDPGAKDNYVPGPDGQVPQIPHIPEGENPNMSMAQIKGEAAKLWESGIYLDELYKEHGNKHGASQFIKYYSGLSANKRAQEKLRVEAGNFAVDLFHKYGEYPGFKSLFGDGILGLTNALVAMKKSDWNKLKNTLSSEASYYVSVKGKKIDLNKLKLEKNFKGEYDFVNDAQAKFFDSFNYGNAWGIANWDSFLGSGDSYNLQDTINREAKYYNALVSGDTNAADKLFSESLKKYKIYLNNDSNLQDQSTFMTEAHRMFKSRTLFKDKFKVLKGQLDNLQKQYDSLPSNQKNGPQGDYITYQMKEVRARMASLGDNQISTSSQYSDTRNAQIRETQKKVADINADMAGATSSNNHLHEKLIAGYESGQYSKMKGYDSMSESEFIDKMMKDTKEANDKKIQADKKRLLKIKEEDYKRGQITKKELDRYRNFTNNYDPDNLWKSYHKKGISTSEKRDLIQTTIDKFGVDAVYQFFQNYGKENDIKNLKKEYGNISSQILDDLKAKQGDISKKKGETPEMWGQRLKRYALEGIIDSNQLKKGLTQVALETEKFVRSKSKVYKKSGSGENQKFSWTDSDGTLHTFDAYGHETRKKPTRKDILNKGYYGTLAKATGKHIEDIKNSEKKAKADDAKYKAIVQQNIKAGIPAKEQAAAALMKAAHGGITINLDNKQVSRDALGNIIIDSKTVAPPRAKK